MRFAHSYAISRYIEYTIFNFRSINHYSCPQSYIIKMYDSHTTLHHATPQCRLLPVYICYIYAVYITTSCPYNPITPVLYIHATKPTKLCNVLITCSVYYILIKSTNRCFVVFLRNNKQVQFYNPWDSRCI